MPKIQINIGQELLEEIDSYAKKIGSNRSAVCNIFISQGMANVARSNLVIEKMTQELTAQLADDIANFINEQKKGK